MARRKRGTLACGAAGGGAELSFQGVDAHVRAAGKASDGGGREGEYRQVLFSLCGRAPAGQLTALLGPSGAGKTTLLHVLAGRKGGAPRTGGEVRVDGAPLTKASRREVGFVAQNALLWPLLTVRESLTAAALLRLPRDMPHAAKLRRVESTLEALRLVKCAETIVGNALRRGVSGGEQKRVAVGLELLMDPRLILLDEPTSGLDANNALTLMELLGGLSGCTVVLSIHQPSSRIWHSLDQTLVLSAGKFIWRGTPGDVSQHLSKVGVPLPEATNPADFLMDVATGYVVGDEQLAEIVAACPPPSESVPSVSPEVDAPAADSNFSLSVHPTEGGRQGEGRWPAKWATQVRVLVWRNFRARLDDALTDKWRNGMLITIGFLCGAVMWWQTGEDRSTQGIDDTKGLLFFLSIFTSFVTLFNSLITFIAPELNILISERTSGWYRLSAYYVARTIADIPLDFIAPLIVAPQAYLMAGLRYEASAFFAHLFIIMLSTITASSVGVLVGAVTQNMKHGQTISTVFMISSMLAGGFYIDVLPSYAEWVPYLSFLNYSYSALLKVEFPEGSTYECSADDKGTPVAGSPGECDVWADGLLVETPFGVSHGAWPEVGVLVGVIAVVRVLTYFALRYKTSSDKK